MSTLICRLHYDLIFLPTPLAVVWVFRLTFYPSPSSPSSYPPPPPPPPHLLHLGVSLRYRKFRGGSFAVYAVLFELNM